LVYRGRLDALPNRFRVDSGRIGRREANVMANFCKSGPLGLSERIGVSGLGAGGGLFKRAVVGRWPWSHLAALVVLALAGPFVHAWPPVATSAFACAVLVALAAWERATRAKCLEPDSAARETAPSIGP